MPLPVTISGVKFPGQNYYCGPFRSSAGNYYTILINTTTAGELNAMKATDPTSSFAEVDAVNAPDVGADPDSVWVYQVGDTLHIVTEGATAPELQYHTFVMSTDLWGTKNETVEDIKVAPTSSRVASAVGLRSDGDVIVLYNGGKDAVMGVDYDRVDYARKEGVTWTVGVAVDNAGELNWSAGPLVVGSSDRMHLYLSSVDAPIVVFAQYQRCLRAANTLETFPASFATIGTSANQIKPGASYVSGGNTKVRVPFRDSTIKLTVVKCDSADTPTVSSDTGISTATISALVTCLAVDGQTLHALWADSATVDLFHDKNANDGGWGTDTEVLDAVTINRLSSRVYDRAGIVLAYVYNDAGTVKYNEMAVVENFPPLLQSSRVQHVRIP